MAKRRRKQARKESKAASEAAGDAEAAAAAAVAVAAEGDGADADPGKADGAAEDDVPSLDLMLKVQKQNGKPGWTEEADKYIMAYVEKHGKSTASWEALSDKFGRHRSASGVRSRWYMLAGPSANIKGGWVEKRYGKKKDSSASPDKMTGDESRAASPSADTTSPTDGGGVARTSSGSKKKQRIETASELGIATRDTSIFQTPAPALIGPPLPQRAGRTAFYLAGVAPHLTCSLCQKLFEDAHTIRECLHTFCKTCVDSHVEEFRNCPDCGIKVKTGTTTAPIRSDRALQSLVDKIKAVLKEREPAGVEDDDDDDEGDASLRMASPTNKERAARKELLATVAREGGHGLGITLTPVPQEQSAASAEDFDSKGTAALPSNAASPGSQDLRAVSPVATSPTHTSSPKLRRTRLTVSERTTVFHLKQFLATAFAVRSVKQVEVLCVGAALGDDMSLEYVLKTHWRGHAHDELLSLHYQMREA
eukprot:COSAG02_NODE_4476_length_5322_cov_34.435573_4_plen_479_part_00